MKKPANLPTKWPGIHAGCPKISANRQIRLLLLLVFWLAAGFLLNGLGQTSNALADNEPTVRAQAAIVVDVTSGGILFGKNIHRRLPMASTTKIMTALTALAVPGTNLNETYTVVQADLVGEASMGLKLGEVISFQNLLYGMLLNSGNDAATAIARYAGTKLPGSADPVARFVSYMNSFAPQLGLRNSHYANPHGLDQADHYTSAFDLAITGWYALKNPVLSKIISTPSISVAGHNLTTLNPLLLNHYAGANGVKPGYTDNAGLCLVGSASRNGQAVLSVILGDDNAGYRSDPPALLDYGFKQLGSSQVQQTLQQGATGATAADYIGRPDGNRLMPFGSQPPDASQSGSTSIISVNSDGTIVQAQITQDQTTPNPTVTTQTGGSSSPGGSDSSSKSGGFNFFMLLFFLLIALGIIYCVLRFTPFLGDRGKDFAYQMEDGAMRGWDLLRGGVVKLWHFVRPGNQEDETPNPSRQRPPSLTGNDLDRNRRVQTALDRGQSSRAASQSTASASYRALSDEEANSYTPPPSPRSRPTPAQDQPLPPSTAGRNQNPLENFFDDEAGPATTSSVPQPPLPLSPTPVEPPRPERPATNRPFVRPPMINSTPAQPPTPLQPTMPLGRPASSEPLIKPTSETNRPTARPLSQPQPPDSVLARARQAIDYAYAGRLTASTEEFRGVVEQDPLFDFGSIDEFEHMPVLGFKALANAYREVNRIKFAVLLLDMAVERYPNDLELRNLQRTLRRD